MRRKMSDFEKRWLKLFASEISEKDIEKYVVSYGNYIWHVFSWELKPKGSCLVGDAAQEAFDRADKSGARYYEPFPENGEHEPSYDSPSAAELDELIECYALSADESWTYIKTHEGDLCGPYFYKREI